jgi:uncharacterized protein YndB with AHSA1/START domain
MKTTKVLVEVVSSKPVRELWDLWTKPEHITQWYYALDTWHAPAAENDLRVNGRFKTRMEAKDGSMGFDFEGVYTEVSHLKRIDYKLADGREVSVRFNEIPGGVRISELFDIETINSPEIQRNGWQSILDNFKNYAEKTLK